MATDFSLPDYLDDCKARVELALGERLPDADTLPQTLHQAMRYAVLGDGKRIRPVLVYATGRALGVLPEQLDAAACAVELIHAYSLVHDDLPAMDDDSLRRGRPTTHVAFDEATAILAGDALQTLAFQVLCRDQTLPVAAPVRLSMIEALALASGSRGMAGGQALDLEAMGREIDLAQLENIHIHKTGALILASVRLGTLVAADADPIKVKQLEHYAKAVGLAFQVQDDILDVVGDPDITGKTQGKDADADKPTYPALLGLAEARDKAEELILNAINCLQDFDKEADPLRNIAQFIMSRTS